MRSFLVLLLLVSGILGHANYTECQISEENAEDIQMHECRACTSFSIPSFDADSNCPSKGYECDESLPITTNVLSAGDDCTCAYLKCIDSRSELAVDGAITKLGKLFCKARKWTTSNNSEVSSFVCARKCGLGVCDVLPRKSFEGQTTYGPFVISPPDGDHPCAWGICEHGAVVSNGGVDRDFYGVATFSCAGDRTWTYTGPEAEQRQLKSIRCLIVGIRSFSLLTFEACEKFDDEYGLGETCSEGIVETADSIKCPSGFNVLIVGEENYIWYNEVVRDPSLPGGWCFKYEGEPCASINDVESGVGTPYRFGCSTYDF